jgi:myosin heavy subunit
VADQPITTSIDSLVNYLNEHGETDTTTLATFLKVSERTVADWAGILEKAGMIKISYKIGKMYLSRVAKAGVSAEVEKSIREIKKKNITDEISAQQIMLNNITAKVETYSKTVTDAENIFKEKAGTAKETLGKLTSLENEMNKVYSDINTKKQNVESAIDKLEQEMAALQKDSSEIGNFSHDMGGAIELMQDILKRAGAVRTGVEQANKDLDAVVEEHRKRLRKMDLDIRSEILSLQDMINNESRKIHKYERLVEDYKRKAYETSQRINKTRTEILDSAIKDKENALRIYNAADAEAKKLQQSITNMKSSWGVLSSFNDSLNGVNSGIAELLREVADMRKALDDLSREVTAEKDLDNDQQKIERLDKKAKQLRDVTDTLNKKKDTLEKKVDDLSK